MSTIGGQKRFSNCGFGEDSVTRHAIKFKTPTSATAARGGIVLWVNKGLGLGLQVFRVFERIQGFRVVI